MYYWTLPNGRPADRIGTIETMVDSLKKEGRLPYSERMPLGPHDWVFSYLISRGPRLHIKIGQVYSSRGERLPNILPFHKIGNIILTENDEGEKIAEEKPAYFSPDGNLYTAPAQVIPYAHDEHQEGMFIGVVSPVAQPRTLNGSPRFAPGHHRFKNDILAATKSVVFADCRPVEQLAASYGKWVIMAHDPKRRLLGFDNSIADS